ncbi:MAG: hypothetical protein K2V38_15345 [Gemmataceae bacterium]|nr:hypothetical protein [Gemmataceae bacterium]
MARPEMGRGEVIDLHDKWKLRSIDAVAPHIAMTPDGAVVAGSTHPDRQLLKCGTRLWDAATAGKSDSSPP